MNNVKYPKWVECIRNSSNNKVLLMLSGGKDSIAALLLLRKYGINVAAIHFHHRWSSEVPTSEAKRICKKHQIHLIIKDFTDSLSHALRGYTAGRPCLLCKRAMYLELLKIIESSNFGWICIGDNANDRTTISRIRQCSDHNATQLICTRYLGSEMGIELPPPVQVVRPLIMMQTPAIEHFLDQEGEKVKQIHSTGDKYFEYHREGCPLQFADIGTEHNAKLWHDLQLYNKHITEFARMKGILASIHLPSTFIITIPKGYEEEAAQYMNDHGCSIDNENNSYNLPATKTFLAQVFRITPELKDNRVSSHLFARFLERLEITGAVPSSLTNDISTSHMYENGKASVLMHLNFRKRTADIRYSIYSEKKTLCDKIFFDNLLLELFRTRRIISFEYSTPPNTTEQAP